MIIIWRSEEIYCHLDFSENYLLSLMWKTYKEQNNKNNNSTAELFLLAEELAENVLKKYIQNL